jgi:hypothetical protein
MFLTAFAFSVIATPLAAQQAPKTYIIGTLTAGLPMPSNLRATLADALRKSGWIEETAAAVKEIGAQHFVLATDLGQTGNPSPADGLQLFVADLMKVGVSKDDVTKMGREVTGSLLMG